MGVRSTLLFLTLLAASAAAEEPGPGLAGAAIVLGSPGDLARDPTAFIGMTLPEAYSALGVPSEVFSYRGAEAWQDDVVFYFSRHVYLFWYRNRVWQVRADARFGGEFLGIRMGAGRDEVLRSLGRQFQEAGDSLVFFLPDASLLEGAEGRRRGAYPLRLRAFFREGKLADVYIYRGDF